MSQSLARVTVHLVFSTKNRVPFLKSRSLRSDLYAYMATVVREEVDSPALVIGGVEDHVHALLLLSRNFAIKSIVEKAKTSTSKWLKTQSSQLSSFHWQGGYGIFSVSQSSIPAVKRYIENQEAHHKKMSFQDEFCILCERHKLQLDERYAWD